MTEEKVILEEEKVILVETIRAKDETIAHLRVIVDSSLNVTLETMQCLGMNAGEEGKEEREDMFARLQKEMQEYARDGSLTFASVPVQSTPSNFFDKLLTFKGRGTTVLRYSPFKGIKKI